MFQLILENKGAIESVGATSGFSFGSIGPIVTILFALALAILVWWLMRRASAPTLHGLSKERIQKQWQEIQQARQHGDMGRKLAIIEADKLLDHVLKALGFPGETMAERMKVAEYKHPKIRDVWFAHKWRNQLVHETAFSLSERQVKEGLAAYESVLRALHLL
jgi:hypothetical protein